MIGKKLDAQSYTVLLLAMVGILLSLNLYAQMRSSRVEPEDAEYTFNTRDSDRALANAAQSLSSATDRIAESNAQIADSIDKLAKAVSELEMVVNVGEDGQVTKPSSGAATASSGAAPSGPTKLEGTFKLN